MRLDIRRIAAIKENQDVIGSRTRVRVVKNKVAPPFKEAEFDIIYGKGVSRSGELIDMAVNASIVDKSGAWFSYGSERLGQGRENAKRFMEDTPEVAEEVLLRVREKLGLVFTADAPEAE